MRSQEVKPGTLRIIILSQGIGKKNTMKITQRMPAAVDHINEHRLYRKIIESLGYDIDDVYSFKCDANKEETFLWIDLKFNNGKKSYERLGKEIVKSL